MEQWQPKNTVDETYHNYFKMLQEFKTENTFNNIERLYEIANLCPLEYGTVVFAARNLYNSVSKQNIIFDENCNNATGSRQINSKVNKVVVEQKSNAFIFPNPAKDFTRVNCTDMRQIDIYDAMGRLVFSRSTVSPNYVVATNNFNAGVYFMRIKTASNKIITQKLIIE